MELGQEPLSIAARESKAGFRTTQQAIAEFFIVIEHSLSTELSIPVGFRNPLGDPAASNALCGVP
jgi:hypothetical protein